MSRQWKTLCLVVLLVAAAPLTLADSHQEPAAPYYVWISEVKAKPGQGDAVVKLLMEDAEMYDALIANGAAVEWGVAMPAVHRGGDTGIRYQWITFAGWAGADQFMSAFMTRMQARSDEERKADTAAWEAAVEPGSHIDTINRSLHIGSSSGKPVRYLHLTYRTAKPGLARDVLKFYKESVAPVYARLVADGSVSNYGLHAPAVRQGQPWTFMGWYATENLAGRDAEAAAFDAQVESSPEETEKWLNAMNNLLEPGYDEQILMVVHHKAAASDGE